MNVSFPLASTFVLKYIFDALTAMNTDTNLIILYIFFYIIVLILLQCLKSVQSVLYDSIIKKAEHKYDCDLFEKLAKLPMSVIDTSEGKDIIEDVQYTKNIAVNLTFHLVRIISMFYSFCIALTTLVIFNIWFSLLFLVLTVPGIILDIFFDKRTEELRFETAPDVRKFCYYRWMLTDAWPAKDVRMYDLTNPIKERYDAEKDIYRKANKKLDKKKLYASLFSETIKRCGEIAFTVFVIIKALNGTVTIGDATLYIGLSLSATVSFENTIGILIMGFIRTTEVMGRFFEFINIKCYNGNKNTRELVTFESLTFENVFFKYPLSEKYVLSGTTFTLNRGDKLSIIGINGSGKSTIIKVMLGLYQIESGQILINGYPMSDYDIKDVRKLFSVLFQTFVHYPLTLRDNIALSDYERQSDDTQIIESLRKSGIYESCDKFEFGLDTYMTRQFDDYGAELSKGQWQKIALSRAYFKKAPIIIFDEPSAALDAEAEDKIFRNFEAISGNKTGIMISHRISSARISNKIIVLDGGRIVEQGTHDELISLNGLYARLYNLQKEKYTVKEVT